MNLRAQLDRALEELPLFPLPQVVLFPGAPLSLHIFEPRYRAMLRDCLAGNKAMAVVQIEGPGDDVEHPRIAKIAGVGVVVEHEMLADGRSNILLLGQARVELAELPFVPPYRRAKARLLEESGSKVPSHDHTALVSAATQFAADVRRHDPTFNLRIAEGASAAQLADLCAHQLVVDPGSRQRILEEVDPRERVLLVVAELARQRGALHRDAGAGILN